MSEKEGTFKLEIVDEENGRCRVKLGGVIDENADLTPLADLRARHVVVNMASVRRINSFGVRSWLQNVARIPKEVGLEFEEVPPAVIDQCNMVRGFLGHGEASSFYAMMVCEACDAEVDVLFMTRECQEQGGTLPETRCPSCSGPMEIDDIEEQYLSFLQPQ